MELRQLVVAATALTSMVVGAKVLLDDPPPLPERLGVVVPAKAGPWTRARPSPVLAKQLRQLRASIKERLDADRVIAAEYSGPIPRMQYVGAEGDFDDPAGILNEYLTTAGATRLTDAAPGPLGGVLSCGLVPLENQVAGIQCGWADQETLGSLFFFDPGLRAQRAAGLTREFRSAAER